MFRAPSLTDIMKDLRNSVKSEVAGTDPWIWPNNLVPVLKAVAQALRAAYLRMEFIHEQAYVSTARGEYLDFHGIQTGGLSRNPATLAQGIVAVVGTLGTVIPDGTVIQRNDGAQFSTLGTFTQIVSPMDLSVHALDTGELSNTDAGAVLTLVTPIAGVTSLTVTDSGIIGGQDGESDDSFRQRILFFKQNPAHGGSPPEYVEWAQTKYGVTRVFIQRATPQPGSVSIYFMMDGTGTGIPTAADVLDMKNILDSLAPSDADVIVGAPIPEPIDIEIHNLQPDTADMRNKVIDELKATFVREVEPASAAVPFVFSKSWIAQAMSHVPKWRRGKVFLPADDVTVTGAGKLATLGDVTFA